MMTTCDFQEDQTYKTCPVCGSDMRRCKDNDPDSGNETHTCCNSECGIEAEFPS